MLKTNCLTGVQGSSNKQGGNEHIQFKFCTFVLLLSCPILNFLKAPLDPEEVDKMLDSNYSMICQLVRLRYG